MTISIPDTLTVDTSGKYIVSIRLRSDGFSFSGYIPSVPGSFFCLPVRFTPGSHYVDTLKEIFFAHPFFAWTFQQVRIITETSHYTLIPEVLYDEKRKHEFLDFALSSPAISCAADVWQEKVLLYPIDAEVEAFCSRSFIAPRFYAHLTPELLFWEKDNLKRQPAGRLYVALHEKMIDLVCFRRGELVFVNSFAVSQAEDILYYILYVWKQLGLDQEKDELFMHGKPEMYSRVAESLHTYLRHVSPVEIPSETYLLGEAFALAPMDLIALSICE